MDLHTQQFAHSQFDSPHRISEHRSSHTCKPLAVQEPLSAVLILQRVSSFPEGSCRRLSGVAESWVGASEGCDIPESAAS